MPASAVYVSDHKENRAEELRRRHGINAYVGAGEFVGKVDVLVLAVKPKDATKALAEISPREDTLIISVMAGITLAALERALPNNPCIRVMPNTPQSVGEGMAAYAMGSSAREHHQEIVETIFAAVGKVVGVTENLMDAVTGLSGSGPAFAFLVIDALADGGVAAGLPRAKAITLAAQTMLGAAKMVLETHEHPDVLRDAVTSPGGTTVAGIRKLERCAVRSAFIEAVLAATKRSRELGG